MFQHNGYAKEALNLLCAFIFDQHEAEDIFAIVDVENHSSITLPKSLGMINVDGFEEKLMCKERLRIEHKYSIKRANWAAF